MNQLKVDLSNIYTQVAKEEVFALKTKIAQNQLLLEQGTGKGSDFLGWLNLPSSITKEQLYDIQHTASELRAKSDVVVIVGIGGSYLGAKAAIDSLSSSFTQLTEDVLPKIIFAGNSICEDYHAELLELLETKRYSIVVISKSGTTTEPAITFRVLKQHLERQVGKTEAASRIVAITDLSKGALRKLADSEGYILLSFPMMWVEGFRF